MRKQSKQEAWKPYKLTYHVYGLKCPMDNTIKYVGMTKNLIWRYASHCCRNPSTSKEKMDWVLMLRRHGLKPELVIFKEVGSDKNTALIIERKFIEKYKDTIYNKVVGRRKGTAKSFNIKDGTLYGKFKRKCIKNKRRMSEVIEEMMGEYVKVKKKTLNNLLEVNNL